MKKILLLLMAAFVGFQSLAANPPPLQGGFQLTVDKTFAVIGEAIPVSWISGTDASNSDWIAAYRANQSPDFYLPNYIYATAPSGSGSITFTNNGEFMIGYFRAGTFEPRASPIKVTIDFPGEAQSGYSVSLSTNAVSVGVSFTVAYTAPAGANTATDLIRVYPETGSPVDFVAAQYVKGHSGVVHFTINTVGRYKVQYFDNNSFVDRSLPVVVEVSSTGTYTLTVNPPAGLPRTVVLVSWQSPPSANIKGDVIRLWPADSTPENYLMSFAVEGKHQGQSSFTLPDWVGDYKIGYFKNGSFATDIPPIIVTVVPSFGDSYSVSFATNMITLGKRAKVTLTSPWNIDNWSHWIALYKVGAWDSDYIEWKYVYYLGGQTDFLITEPGTYEIRYFDNEWNHNAVAVSEVLYVNEPPPDVTRIKNYPPCSGQNIIVFGGDLAYGTGSLGGANLPTDISRIIGRPVINAGVAGDTSETALARLQSSVLAKNPKVVLILLGDQDLLDGTVSSTTIANMRSIITQIQNTGAAVVLVGIEGGQFGNGLKTGIQLLATQMRVAYIPNILRGIVDPLLSEDGVYPNNDGYALMAQRIAPTIASLVSADCGTPTGPPGGTAQGTAPTLTITVIGTSAVIAWQSVLGQPYGLVCAKQPDNSGINTCVTNLVGTGNVLQVVIPTAEGSLFFRATLTPCQ